MPVVRIHDGRPRLIGRDNARTPMQWDASKYAGFTAPDAPVEPWTSVNPNHVEINAAEEFDDPDSVYTFLQEAHRHAAQQRPPSPLANGICSPPTAIRCMLSRAPMATTRFLSWSTSPTGPRRCLRTWRSCFPTACPIRKYCSAPMMLCIVLNRSLVASSLAGRES